MCAAVSSAVTSKGSVVSKRSDEGKTPNDGVNTGLTAARERSVLDQKNTAMAPTVCQVSSTTSRLPVRACDAEIVNTKPVASTRGDTRSASGIVRARPTYSNIANTRTTSIVNNSQNVTATAIANTSGIVRPGVCIVSTANSATAAVSTSGTVRPRVSTEGILKCASNSATGLASTAGIIRPRASAIGIFSRPTVNGTGSTVSTSGFVRIGMSNVGILSTPNSTSSTMSTSCIGRPRMSTAGILSAPNSTGRAASSSGNVRPRMSTVGILNAPNSTSGTPSTSGIVRARMSTAGNLNAPNSTSGTLSTSGIVRPRLSTAGILNAPNSTSGTASTSGIVKPRMSTVGILNALNSASGAGSTSGIVRPRMNTAGVLNSTSGTASTSCIARPRMSSVHTLSAPNSTSCASSTSGIARPRISIVGTLSTPNSTSIIVSTSGIVSPNTSTVGNLSAANSNSAIVSTSGIAKSGSYIGSSTNAVVNTSAIASLSDYSRMSTPGAQMIISSTSHAKGTFTTTAPVFTGRISTSYISSPRIINPVTNVTKPSTSGNTSSWLSNALTGTSGNNVAKASTSGIVSTRAITPANNVTSSINVTKTSILGITSSTPTTMDITGTSSMTSVVGTNNTTTDSTRTTKSAGICSTMTTGASISNVAVRASPAINDIVCEPSSELDVRSTPRSDCRRKVTLATDMSQLPENVSSSDRLRFAASKGQLDKVKELLLADAVIRPDREGRTAVHYAALNGHAEVVSLLVNEVADINGQDNLGYTALHRAAAQGHLEVIRVLLSEGCAIDRQDEVHGNSALHEAAWNGYSHTMELMLKHNANVHIFNKAGFCPLHLAAQNGHNQSARVLLYAGANADQQNNYGDTALHTAARYGHAGVTRILLSARCNANQQNKNGDTALHISAALKRRKITKLLTEAGVDATIKNKQNETAVDVAKRKDYPEIILMITSKPVTKKSRFGRKKSSKVALPGAPSTSQDDSEKKEKKGFFFRKKSKAKMEKEKEVVSRGSEVCLSQILSEAQQPQPVPNRHHHAAAPSRAGGAKTVQGLLSRYQSKAGVQYYRDLAGNIKQGPIGYMPTCNCGPQLQRLQKRMEVDRGQLYDHVQASHQTLAQRLTALDDRCSQQVHAMERLGNERLEAAHVQCARTAVLNARHAQHQMERYVESADAALRTDLQMWMDTCSTLRTHAVVHRPQLIEKRRRRDVDRHNGSFEFDPPAPPPGKLIRSKSDDTLSQSSVNGRCRPAKLIARGEEELHFVAAAAAAAAKPRDNAPQGLQRCRTRSFNEPRTKPAGRSPEGRAEDAEFCEGAGHGQYDAWYRHFRNARQFEKPDGEAGRQTANPPNTTTVLAQVHKPDSGSVYKASDTASKTGPLAGSSAAAAISAQNQEALRWYEPKPHTTAKPESVRTVTGTADQSEIVGKATQV